MSTVQLQVCAIEPVNSVQLNRGCLFCWLQRKDSEPVVAVLVLGRRFFGSDHWGICQKHYQEKIVGEK